MNLETLKQIVSYDPETGDMRWLQVKSGHAQIGDIVGNTRGQTRIRGENFVVAHLAAWLMTGHKPSHRVKHLDGDRTNLKWNNLEVKRPPIPKCHRPHHSINLKELAYKTFPLGLPIEECVVEDAGIWSVIHWITGEETGTPFFAREEAVAEAESHRTGQMTPEEAVLLKSIVRKRRQFIEQRKGIYYFK